MLEPKVFVLSLVLSNLVSLPRKGVRRRLLETAAAGACRLLPHSSVGPRPQGGRGAAMGRIILDKLNHSAVPGNGRGHPGKRTIPGGRFLDPTLARRKQRQAPRKAQRAAHSFTCIPRAPPLRPGVPPEPGARSGVGVRLSRVYLLCHWCSRIRGRRRPPLPRGVAAPLLPRGRGSLPGASAPTSPAQARPWRPPAPRNPNCARGLTGRPPFTPQQRTQRPAEPRPLTRPHLGGAAAAAGHPQNGINERAREAASGEPGAGTGARGQGRAPRAKDRLRCSWGRLWAPGPSGEGGDPAE